MIGFFGIFLALFACAQADENAPFLWGVANSAFQTESEPAPSDWLSWTNLAGRIEDGTKPSAVFGFYENYEKEFELAQKLGLNSFRMSIAWERIEPESGRFDEKALDHYEKMILAMRTRGMEPVISLHHFVNPVWLKEGILSPGFSDAFARYAVKVVTRLGNGPAKVRWWITINEPSVLAKASYLDGDWPPGLKDMQATLVAMAELVRAHIKTVNAIRALPGSENFRLGVAKHWRPFEAKSYSPLDWLAAKITDRFFNRQVLGGMLTGKIRMWAPGASRVADDLTLLGDRPGLDFIGLNYYGRSVVEFTIRPPFVRVSEGEGPKSELGWEIYPEGLYQSLKQLAEYRLPVLVTENGVADSRDLLRPDFIRDHIAALDRARGEGLPVLGYMHWSLTDNFEWSRGLTPKFGLCGFSGVERVHECRPSFEVYRQIISAHRRH